MFHRLAAALLLSAPLFAGGAWLSFSPPETANDPAAAGAFTTIKLVSLGSMTLDNTEVTGTAEGLVDGQRVSRPIVIEKLSTPGLRAIRWQPTSEGQWVLAFEVGDHHLPVVVRVQPAGVKRQMVLMDLGASWKDKLIDAGFTGVAPPSAAALPPGIWRAPQ